MAKSPLPSLEEAGAFYWQSGQHGQYRLAWCCACEIWLHPARELCPHCLNDAETKTASGTATLASFTVNHQAWPQGQDTPYTLAIICPVEDPTLQITTKLVNCDTTALQVGMAVDVVFEQHDDVWLPCFKPAANKAAINTGKPILPSIHINTTNTQNKYESTCAFTGIGASEIGKKLPQSPLKLTTQACIRATQDANLTLADIDGVCAYPGTTGLPGLSSGGVRELAYALNLKPNWHNGAQETPGQAGAISAAMQAIAAGLCQHVLCFTTFASNTRPHPQSHNGRVIGEPRWSLPFGCVSPANWIGMYANRYMQQFGADEKLLGTLAIAQRNHARHNPNALYREPLDMATYLGSRKISTPFKLLDCDTPCDGAIAFIISRSDTSQDQVDKPIYIEAFGSAFAEVQTWDQGTLLYQPNVLSASRHLWSRTDYTPSDVDIAQLYDGFSFNAICWLEALGFCEAGGATDFIGDGSTLGINGKLPLNTHGGHLNAGRSNGYGHIFEAITQLRGEAGERQVNKVNVAAVSTGGGIPASAMLLRNNH